MSKKCPACGKTHEAVEFCPYCNTKVPELDPASTLVIESDNHSFEKFGLRDLHPIALFLVLITVGFVMVEIILAGIYGGPEYAGRKSIPIISLGIGYICGDYAASHWAPKIHGSKSWAFVIPFFTNILGLACYWLYFQYKLRK